MTFPLNTVTPQTFKDLVIFGRCLVWTRDLDPVYPLIKTVGALRGLSRYQLHWLVMLYLAYYNVSSAWAAFCEFPEPLEAPTEQKRYIQWEAEHRPQCNIERRGLRGGKTHLMLVPLSTEVEGDLEGWLTQSWTQNATTNFTLLWDRVQMLPHVGRWAAFKLADLLLHVLDYTIEFPDMRLADCSGPRQALEELYGLPGVRKNTPDYITQLDVLGQELADQLTTAGLFTSWDVLETILCNWGSTVKGHYYVGHDLDEGLGDLLTGLGDRGPWMAARRQIAPSPALLGELNGWTGVRKELLTLYKRERKIHCDVDLKTIMAG